MRPFLLLFLFYSILAIPGWKNQVYYLDEENAIFIMHGISLHPDKDIHRSDWKYLDTEWDELDKLNVRDIEQNNSLSNVWHQCILDGGNGQLYYLLGHSISKCVAKYIGMVNSLRLLNFILGFIAAWILFKTLRLYNDINSSIVATMVYICMSLWMHQWIRTYVLSDLLSLIYLNLVLSVCLAKSSKENKQLYLLLVVAVLFPFSGAFNVIFIFTITIILILLSLWYKLKIKNVRWIIASAFASLTIFTCYHIFENETGRLYQMRVNEFWQNYATSYGSSANTWLPYWSPYYAIRGSAEWLIRLFALDFRPSFSEFPFTLNLLALSLPGILLYLFWKNKQRYDSTSLIPAISSVSILPAYFSLMNLLYWKSDHAIALSNYWYGSVCMATTIIAITVLSQQLSRGAMNILRLLVLLIGFNAFMSVIRPEYTAVLEERESQLIEKIELYHANQ